MKYKLVKILIFIFLGTCIVKIPVVLLIDKILLFDTFARLSAFTLFHGICCALMLLLVYIFTCLWDRKTLASVGIQFHKGIFVQFIRGAGITFIAGLGTWAVFFLSEHPNYAVISGSVLTVVSVFWGVILGVLQTATEELWFRSWVINEVRNMFGVKAAVVTNGLLFALLHFLNPSYSIIAVCVTCIAGMMISYSYFCFESVWMPIGLHFGWNYFLGSIMFNKDIFKIMFADGRYINLFTAEGSPGALIFVTIAFVFIIYKYSPKRMQNHKISLGVFRP